MKKYYRSRYATFLKALNEKNKKKEEELEKLKKKEENRKKKAQEAVQHVQSKFMEAPTTTGLATEESIMSTSVIV